MRLNNEKRKINKYLSSEKSWPIIVDLQTRDDLSELKEFFNIGENKILPAQQFCGENGIFKLEEFYDAISKNEGNTFIIEICTFLKLQGEIYTKSVLKDIATKNINGHVVVLTYQCKNFLKFSDPRIAESGRVIISNEEPDTSAKVCLISPDLANAFPDSYDGFDKIAYAIENDVSDTIYLSTDIDKKIFPKSIFNIMHISNGYDILCSRDSRTSKISLNLGSSYQWNYVLKIMGDNGDWSTVAKNEFGTIHNLSQFVSSYHNFDDMRRWLYYVILSILEVKDNEYLQLAVNNTSNYEELINSIFRTLLTVDKDDSDFNKLYEQRKNIIHKLQDTTCEVADYCKVVSIKEKDYIYYLTDLSQLEKEKVIIWLDTYGLEYDVNMLTDILNKVYPDLASYLSVYRFKNELLDTYFEAYKYQKVINKILPSFETIVDEQSHELGFVDVLKPRTSLTDKIDLCNSQAYFLDALGVEYLGFIQDKCDQYGLSTNITCARCELPSLTCYNKEFVETFQNKGCGVANIKDLDEIKHHGENSFDYEKVKIPIYLIKELEIIDSLLKKIRSNILNGVYEKGIIISDHGASRLAVLHNTENKWSMATSGKHSGRCCPQNEIDTKPDFSIEKEGYWILANYDRFKGGRRANCEVHGGATIEEVAVPIIEITQKQYNIEAFILEESKNITLGAKEFPVIKIYVGTKSNNVSIRLNGTYYDATELSENIYKIELVDCTKKGIYSFDIQIGSENIAVEQQFEIKKKGMLENDLFS